MVGATSMWTALAATRLAPISLAGAREQRRPAVLFSRHLEVGQTSRHTVVALALLVSERDKLRILRAAASVEPGSRRGGPGTSGRCNSDSVGSIPVADEGADEKGRDR